MSASEKFCLRWNDFESNISVAFRELREEKDFFDVTLSVGPGHQHIQAHKLVLSACSPFFRGVLRQNPHAHPLLYLKGVGFSELQSVLNFMYHGEVNVAQEELNTFLAVAEELQVKGLTQGGAGGATTNSTAKPKSDPAPPRSRPAEASPAQIPKPRPRPAPIPNPTPFIPPHDDMADDDIQEVLPIVKTELPAVYQPPASQQAGTVAHMEEQYTEEGYEDYGGYEGGQGFDDTTMMEGDQNKGDYDEFILKIGSVYSCGLCGKMFAKGFVCRRHIKEIHFSAGRKIKF